MQDMLLPAVLKARGKPTEAVGEVDKVLGIEMLGDLVFVNQAQIGKTTRSNPVSYVGAFEPIRKRFAATDAARERGYTAGTFSFNSGYGRCPTTSFSSARAARGNGSSAKSSRSAIGERISTTCFT